MLLAGALFMLAAPELTAQTIDAGDFRLKLIGRIQSQFNTTSINEVELVEGGLDPDPIPSSTFEIRRLRLGTELTYHEWLTGKLELEFAMARVQMRDVFVNFGFDPRLNLRVGQFKKPFSLLQLHSSSMWPVIERGLRIRGLDDQLALQDTGSALFSRFRGAPVLPEEQALLEVFGYQNFELGAALHGRFGGLGYTAGVFNGTGSDGLRETDRQSYAARLTYTLPTEYPITVGSAISHRDHRLPRSGTPVIQTSNGSAYEFDVELGAFRRTGLHLLGEIAFGDNLADADQEFLGAQAVLAYFRPLAGTRLDGIELAARASYGDPRRDLDDDSAWLITPGINLYFTGRNRLMLNWDFFSPSADRFTSENALRAQAQLYF
jgi:hypothetical protein